MGFMDIFLMYLYRRTSSLISKTEDVIHLISLIISQFSKQLCFGSYIWLNVSCRPCYDQLSCWLANCAYSPMVWPALMLTTKLCILPYVMTSSPIESSLLPNTAYCPLQPSSHQVCSGADLWRGPVCVVSHSYLATLPTQSDAHRITLGAFRE